MSILCITLLSNVSMDSFPKQLYLHLYGETNRTHEFESGELLYSRFASSVLVLPSATPEERSERGRKDQTVAARVPPRSVLLLPSATPEEQSERGRKDQTVAARVLPRYAFGDRGHINETNKTYRVSFNLVFPRLLQICCGLKLKSPRKGTLSTN
ncbi:hypothetical protein NDU88_007467 [Pleurodeles waltl]|uniref:Uncharacterized protein n=1 Tax=Pleurodeles waltl TaxID=8319 RepID=A0AAV7VQW3_PLEWA|nr:hypothetical protein NDU88_007467 [Pleurodeles waltl]